MNFYGDKFIAPVELTQGTSISEEIDAPAGWLVNVSVRTVTYNRKISSYPIQWQVDIEDGASQRKLASGVIDAKTLRDWGDRALPIPLTTLAHNNKLRVQLSVAKDAIVPSAAGLPLYASSEKHPVISLIGAGSTGALGVTLEYVRR